MEEMTLTKYEIARIIGSRATQIAQGAPLLLKFSKDELLELSFNPVNIAKKEFEAALHLFPPTDSGWIPKVVTCSSLTNGGIEEIWDIIFEYYSNAEESGYLTKKRQKQTKYLMHETIGYMLEESFNSSEKIKSIIDEVEKDVIDGKTNSFSAAQKLFNIYVEQLKD